MISVRFLNRCMRILHIARKPTKKELDEIIKITGLGLLVVGSIGMAMYLIFSVI
ncbi:protein translocase SEC61 complex subunit gamma [Candidatus Micrarchaeota archaeon]|nr:protein translocase SEC61 complex subunit gamma [Candidatus Micrarchaeota archaeon]